MTKIKKLLKTFIITCFLFVCFITTAKAGTSFEIQRQGAYNNLDCGAAIQKLKNFNVTTTPAKYTFTLKDGVEGTVTENITCSYSGGGSQVGATASGKVTYSLTASKATQGYNEYTISFTGTTDDQYNLINAFQASSIKNFSITSGAQYVKVTGCNGSGTCYFNPVETTDGTNTHTVKFSFTAVSDGKEYPGVATMTVTYIGNIAAHPGALGTCTMPSSDWSSDKLGSTWVDMSGTTRLASYYLSKKNTNVKFGTCTPNDPNSVTFVGWVPAGSQKAFDAGVGQLIGVCSNSSGLVKPNGTAANPAKYYSACYEFVASVKLKGLRGGTLSEKWDSYGTDGYIKKASGSSAKITLPSVSYDAYNKANGTAYTFIGWSAGGTDVIPAGTAVAADGTTYTPVINRTETEIDYFKNVYEGETFKLQVGNATGCSLGNGASTYVSASFSNGICNVKGIKITSGNQYAPVVIKKTDGVTVTYKFKVLSNVGTSGYVYDENNIPIIEPGAVAGKNDTYTVAHGDGVGEMIEDSKCNTYAVKYLGESSVWNTDGMKSGAYKVRCSNPSDDLAGVIALCLDPGLMGPDGADDAVYVKSFDVAANSDFAKLLTYLSDRITRENINMSDLNDNKRIAFHIAVRIVGLKYFDNGSNAVLQDNYQTYKKAAKKLPKSGAISTEKAEEIASKMKFDDHKGASVKQQLIKVLTEYRNYSEEQTTTEQFSNVVSTVYKEVKGSDSYTLTYKGKFTLPKGATNITVNAHSSCANSAVSGYTCRLVSHNVLSEPDQFGRVQVEYEVLITVNSAKGVNPPSSTKEKVRKSIVVKYRGKTSAQISILQPTQSDGASYQRLVSIDPTPDTVYVYMPPGTGRADNMCKGTASLNIDNCTDSDHCSEDRFNEDLFINSGCCAFVENEESYVAKSTCKGTCVETTLQSTCQFRPFGSSTTYDKYEIKEGSVLASGHLSNRIGACIVNVRKPINTTNADSASFNKKDSAGNSIMVAEYNSNRYCRVSCKEDFTVTLGAFGNYVGTSADGKKGAVAAGTFFNLDDDIYMGGTRSCYTTFIDYNKYLNDVAKLSQKIVRGYNKVYEGALEYTELEDRESDVVEEETAEYCEEELSTCDCGEADSCSCGNDGSKYCASGNYFTAYRYNIVSDGSADREDSTKWSTAANKTGYSATKEQNVDINSLPSAGGTSYSFSSSNVYGCSATHGKKDEANCKERSTDTVWNEKGKPKMDSAKGKQDSGIGAMSSAYANMLKYARDFFDCQHFQLNPTEIGDKANNAIQIGTYWGNPKVVDGKFYGKTRDYVQIDSKFNPTATYTYDEKTMMDIIGPDNEVEEYTAKNNEIINNYNTVSNVKATYKGSLELYRNYVTYGFYKGRGTNHNLPWQSGSTEEKNYKSSNGYTLEGSQITNLKTSSKAVESARTDEYVYEYVTLCSVSGGGGGGGGGGEVAVKEGATMTIGGGGGGRDYRWHGGACSSVKVYYNKANYVTTSISNSSIYRNKGSWVQSTVNNTYEHGLSVDGGETLVKSALTKANENRQIGYNISKELSAASSGPGVYGAWRLLTVMDNVFPVSFITPRNLYTYTYTFSNIGMYGDGSLRGKLGRILGDDNAVIKENSRTCFYEVYESTCICCGAERIDAYAGIYKTNSTQDKELKASAKVVKEYVDKNPDVKSIVSDNDAMEVNDSGVIGFTVSTVSNGDLNGSPDRSLADNFGTYTFSYDNATYTTDKGESAKKAIETSADNIYNETPEYIYELGPSDIKKIQDYNQSHPYGIDSSTVKVYSQNTIVPINNCNGTNCTWSKGGNQAEYVSNYVTFAHIGSGFLEDVAKDFVPNGYTTLAASDKVCTIMDYDAKDPNKVKNLMENEKCRWIDYIDTSNKTRKVNTYNNVSNNVKQVDAYFRLAYK